MTTAPIWLLAVACASGLISGCLLRVWVSSRRFSRLNHLGVEAFESMHSMALTRIAERLVTLAGTGLLLVGLGFGFVIAARFVFPGLF